MKFVKIRYLLLTSAALGIIGYGSLSLACNTLARNTGILGGAVGSECKYLYEKWLYQVGIFSPPFDTTATVKTTGSNSINLISYPPSNMEYIDGQYHRRFSKKSRSTIWKCEWNNGREPHMGKRSRKPPTDLFLTCSFAEDWITPVFTGKWIKLFALVEYENTGALVNPRFKRLSIRTSLQRKNVSYQSTFSSRNSEKDLETMEMAVIKFSHPASSTEALEFHFVIDAPFRLNPDSDPEPEINRFEFRGTAPPAFSNLWVD